MAKLLDCICPLCGEKTLEAQSEVVWCSNLGSSSARPCQFGLGTGEKTIDDVKTTAHTFTDPTGDCSLQGEDMSEQKKKPRARSSTAEPSPHKTSVAGSTPAAPTKPKRGRPRIGDPPPAKPWMDLGMSERTWYRRQAEEKRK